MAGGGAGGDCLAVAENPVPAMALLKIGGAGLFHLVSACDKS